MPFFIPNAKSNFAVCLKEHILSILTPSYINVISIFTPQPVAPRATIDLLLLPAPEPDVWPQEYSSVAHPDLAKLVRRVMTSSESCINTGGRMGGDGAPGDEVTSLMPVPQMSPSSHPGTWSCGGDGRRLL